MFYCSKEELVISTVQNNFGELDNVNAIKLVLPYMFMT